MKKLKQKVFFLKIWAKNMSVHYTWQNTVSFKVLVSGAYLKL